MQVDATAREPEPYQVEEVEPFLAVPYYGAAYHTAYMDNDGHNYRINGQIELYDHRIISESNGICAYNRKGEGIAYYAESADQGDCIWYEGHTGHDFAVGFVPNVRTGYGPVFAAASGVAVSAGWTSTRDRNEGLGLFIEIEHENGYRTCYGHMSAVLTPTLGLEIPQGYLIGTSGNTGNSSAPHLHFEVFDEHGMLVDPFHSTAHLWEEVEWFTLRGIVAAADQ